VPYKRNASAAGAFYVKMSPLPTNQVLLPTFDRLGVTQADLPTTDEDIKTIVETWFASFSTAISSGSVDQITGLFTSVSCIWRDLLCFSWDFRTLFDDKIGTFLKEHLPNSGFSALKLKRETAQVQVLGPDLAWIAGQYGVTAGETISDTACAYSVFYV
jgi:hypothetical protein